MPKGQPPQSAYRKEIRERTSPAPSDLFGDLAGGLGDLAGGILGGGGMIPGLSASSGASGRAGDISGATGISTGAFSVADRGATADARSGDPAAGLNSAIGENNLIWIAGIGAVAWIVVTALR